MTNASWVAGIDPGLIHSAIVNIERVGDDWRPSDDLPPEITLNQTVLDALWDDTMLGGGRSIVAVERVRPYGMRVGTNVMDTCEWSGAFYHSRANTVWVTRMDVKMHICHDSRAKDADIRQALIDRYGGDRQTAVGTKKNPGPLYGFKKDMWSALAVALTAAESDIGGRAPEARE